jgi:hypothetical protein
MSGCHADGWARNVLATRTRAALGAAVEFTKETWMVLVINAIAVPAIVYWLLANALDLESTSRGMLATVVELAALGVVVWRWRRAWLNKPEP